MEPTDAYDYVEDGYRWTASQRLRTAMVFAAAKGKFPQRIIDAGGIEAYLEDQRMTGRAGAEEVACGRARRHEQHAPHAWELQAEDDSPARVRATCPGFELHQCVSCRVWIEDDAWEDHQC